MKIRLLLVGRTERGAVGESVAAYVKRIERLTTFEQVVVAEAGAGAPAYQQRVESERLLVALKPGERVVVLDERGAQLTSAAFADRLGKWRDQGVKQVAFVIGGAYGVNDALRERADLVLALSAMTFPHQLVRALFAEQLYRAYTILNGTPYHH